MRISSYAPKTLRSEIGQRGRLPASECVEIAIKLAGALEDLHTHGLVHRDVKPSNIIYVRGQPKLADIGLVASSDSSLSCVGTEGFLPPEGPGRPQADLFALGKVLYEISTGRGRDDFPELPTSLRDCPERAAIEELNEVILRACDPDVRRRYPTARAMKSDLELLRRGQSLQRARRRERRWRTLRRSLPLVALAIVLVALVRNWPRQSRARARPLPVPLVVKGAEFWRVPHVARQFDFSSDGERILFTRTNGFAIWERKTAVTTQVDLRGLGDWRLPGPDGTFAMPRWSPDHRRFAFQGVRTTWGADAPPTLAFGLLIVDAVTGETRQIGENFTESERLQDVRWHPENEAITGLLAPCRIVTFALGGGRREDWKQLDLPSSGMLLLGEYSSGGAWLLVSTDSGNGDQDRRGVWAVPHLGGPARQLTGPVALNPSPSWSADDASVYFVTDGAASQADAAGIWRVPFNRRRYSPAGAAEEVITRAGAKFLHPRVLGDGRILAYAVEEPRSEIRVGSADAPGEAALIARGQDPVLSPEGQMIYFVGEGADHAGVFAIHRSGDAATVRRMTSLKPLARSDTRGGLALSPDGKSVALFGKRGDRRGVYQISTSANESEPQFLESVSERDSRVLPVWSPDGRWLALPQGGDLIRVSNDGRAREVLARVHQWEAWSLRWSPDGSHLAAFGRATAEESRESSAIFVVNVAARSLRRLTHDAENQWKEGLEWHPSGGQLAFLLYETGGGSQIRRAFLDGRATEKMIDQENHWDYVGAWAPDGRRFFFHSSNLQTGSKTIHLYDGETGQITREVRGGHLPEWSRDGRVAVWSTSELVRSFEVIEGVR